MTPIPSTDVQFSPPWAGSAPAYISDLFSQEIHSSKFGLKGDMSNETVKLNALFQAAYVEKKTARLAQGAYGVSSTESPLYAAFSRTMNIIGDDGNLPYIFPLPGTHLTADVFLIKPESGDAFEYPTMRNLLVYPKASGSLLGSKGLKIDLSNGVFVGGATFSNVYVQDANSWSMELDVSNNPASSFALFRFQNCHFYNGFRGKWLGDTGEFEQCKFHTTKHQSADGSITFSGADIDTTRHPSPTGPVRPSVIHFSRPNYTGIGPAFTIRSGRHIIIDSPNIENTEGGTGGQRNCVIDFVGDVGLIDHAEVRGGLCSAFGVVNNVSDLINFGNVREGRVDQMAMARGSATALRSAVAIGPASRDISIGRIRVDGLVTQPVFDAGAGTMGIRKSLSINSPFSAVPYLGTPSFMKGEDGRIAFSGGIKADDAASNAYITVLPPRFRPNILRIIGCQVLAFDGSGYLPAELHVAPSGSVMFAGPQKFARLLMDGLFFDTYSNIGSEAS